MSIRCASPEINLADLRAQVAACEKGAQELGRMVAQFGLEVVQAYMGHVQDNAEECVRRAIEALRDAEYVYPMDPDFDGRPREIRVRIDGRPGGAGGGDRLHRDDGGSWRRTTTRRSR